MPKGKFKIANIATKEKVAEVKRGFLDSVKTGDALPEIKMEGDGPWAVIAKFPETDAGASTSRQITAAVSNLSRASSRGGSLNTYGERPLQKGSQGDDVVELQMRLAGFRGTVPDGDFGPGTELQVIKFQQDYIGNASSSGIADEATFAAIEKFAARHPLDFSKLACPCGVCDGFGQNRFRNEYRPDRPKLEAFHLYEYPGIHRMLLWAVRALRFYLPQYNFVVTSGYRCGENNKQKGRTSTNHHGKAIDLDVPLGRGEDKRDDMRRCDEVRGELVERSAAQIGWAARNRKSLEPFNIAPTWIHYDVRSYDRKYLADKYFCTTLEHVDTAPV